MREFARISPRFWTGPTGRQIRQLGPQAQIIALYLISCPHANMLGLYYLPLPFLCHETGLPPEAAKMALERLEQAGFCRYDAASEYVWVIEMARFQIGPALKVTDKQVAGILKALERLPQIALTRAFVEHYQEAFHLAGHAPRPAARAPERHAAEHPPVKETRHGHTRSLAGRARHAAGKRLGNP